MGRHGQTGRSSKADGDRLNDAAETHYRLLRRLGRVGQAVAGHALAALIDEAHPILQRYRDHKRASAQPDFDDLIFAARATCCATTMTSAGAGTAFRPRPRRRVSGHRSAANRKSSGGYAASRSMAMPTGPGSKFGRARSSWSATPSRRSIASGAPMSAPYAQARDAFRARDPGSLLSISHQLPLLRLDPHLRQRALRGRALGRRPAGFHRSRPVP